MLKHAARCDVRVHRSESFKPVFSTRCKTLLYEPYLQNWWVKLNNQYVKLKLLYDSLLSHDMIKQKWKIPKRLHLVRGQSFCYKRRLSVRCHPFDPQYWSGRGLILLTTGLSVWGIALCCVTSWPTAPSCAGGGLSWPVFVDLRHMFAGEHQGSNPPAR